MAKKLAINSVVDQLVSELSKSILSGELKAGQKLVESTIAEEWGVSRASLREAFRILHNQGFIEQKPRKGCFVTKLTPEYVREVYQVRAVLEELAVCQAVKKGGAAHIAELKALNDAMVIAHEEKDFDKYAHLNECFHQNILNAAGNKFLLSVMESIHHIVQRCMTISRPGVHGHSNESHQKLIQFMENGDAVQAGKMRRERVLEVCELVISHMDTNSLG